jgi:hypothetical protein
MHQLAGIVDVQIAAWGQASRSRLRQVASVAEHHKLFLDSELIA